MKRRTVITGTRLGHREFATIMRLYLYKFEQPQFFVIGDANGVDTQAQRHFDGCGLDYLKCHVDKTEPSPQRFYTRNGHMIDPCVPGDHLLAVPDEDSRGTWQCFGLGKKAGLLCVDATKAGWLELLVKMTAEFSR